MDQEKYLNRINYSHELEPSLSTLRKLQKAHLLTVPFENLDIHYNISITLDVNRIFNKIVLNNRGGFCYEMNGLFYKLLKSLGFDAKIISARVYDKEKGYGQEFDHLAIIVDFGDTQYLTDVGFGEFTFSPLEINLNKIQEDQRGNFVIDKFDESYFRVSKIVNGELIPEYIFTNLGRKFVDYHEMCTHHQTNAQSHFTKKKLISIPTEDGRITISGNTLKIKDKVSTKDFILEDEAAFKHSLLSYFKVEIRS